MDFLKMMQQAKGIQEKMGSLQNLVDQIVVDAESGGGTVKIKMSGNGVVTEVEIDPSLMVAGEEEILQDLIIAACQDASAKARQASKDKTQELMGELGFPANMKLPF